ncbi:hypothetical protein IJG93_03810 [Candidatus Saccharibacteria bacterium]|nr:hypothetical protein [Candidatus Saccharibacteria bacterium]
MKKLVKLFFSLILIGSSAVTFATSPVFAEEASEVPTTEETPKEDVDTGSEWDGIINDPVNTTVKEPATTEPTTVVVTKVTTTVTPPATTNHTSTSTIKTETPAETPLEDSTTEETPEDSNTAEIKSDESNEPSDTEVQVPETSTPLFTLDDTTRKITLLALISTTIVYFLSLEIWGLKNLIKIKKNEKLLRSAKEKATEVKQAKITRSTN